MFLKKYFKIKYKLSLKLMNLILNYIKVCKSYSMWIEAFKKIYIYHENGQTVEIEIECNLFQIYKLPVKPQHFY